MIAVLVETDSTGASLVTLEALTFARSLAERSGLGPVHALVVGPVDEPLLAQLADQGVALVHQALDERLTAYAAAAWAAALAQVVLEVAAAAVLAAGTPLGNEVLAHLATRLDVAMAANVLAVEEVRPLMVTRQVVGGAALEEMRLEDGVAVFTLAGHACDPESVAEPTTPRVSPFSPTLVASDFRAQVARTEHGVADSSGALTKARVVVGAGRGAGGPGGFADLLELTELLGGALGVSRVVTSLGWRPHHEQVGQTGSQIAPELYIACGISGAIQHWAGCQNSKTVLAINTDADAPMVTRAHYAVIGDLHEIVPAINAEIRRRQTAS